MSVRARTIASAGRCGMHPRCKQLACDPV
jgi:hypothetical protein